MQYYLMKDLIINIVQNFDSYLLIPLNQDQIFKIKIINLKFFNFPHHFQYSFHLIQDQNSLKKLFNKFLLDEIALKNFKIKENFLQYIILFYLRFCNHKFYHYHSINFLKLNILLDLTFE